MPAVDPASIRTARQHTHKPNGSADEALPLMRNTSSLVIPLPFDTSQFQNLRTR